MHLPLSFVSRCVVALLVVTASIGAGPARTAMAADPAPGVETRIDALLEPLRLPETLETGVLLDRVLSFGGPGAFDATSSAPAATFEHVVQLQSELRRASFEDLGWVAAPEVRERARRWSSEDAIPLVFVEARFESFRTDALQTGALRAEGRELAYGTDQIEDVFVRNQAFVFAPATSRTFEGESVTFVIDPALVFRGTAGDPVDGEADLEMDFGDGRGFTAVRGAFDRQSPPVRVPVSYREEGSKTLRARLSLWDGRVLEAQSVFEVARLGTPAPDQTLAVTASIPYLGQPGTGQAYVYLAPDHTVLTRPIVVIEGFDIDNSLDWPALYDLLNTENLLEDLRGLGYDAVVLDFTDATTYMQRNGLLVVELVQQVQAMVPGEDVVLVGASMGGLLSRYALAYMETNAMPHQVPLWISFDAPHTGASIPLGIQYWVDFFSSESTEAAALLAALNSPAARQLLAYHYTDPPTVTGTPDPLRTAWLTDLAAAGDYPSLPRRVAIANGSGTQVDQGFSAGAQIIDWEYSSLLVDVTGNVWAVPDGSTTQIFEGLIDIFLLGGDSQNVTVTSTDPYDNAPGGLRDSMAQMDAVEAPYGDIVALHDAHCFIPTVSALDVSGADLFEDLAGDPDLVSRTPFDAVYFPLENQDHVLITPENKVWILDELANVASSVPGSDPPAELAIPHARILSVAPHPVTSDGQVRFAVPAGQGYTLSLVDPVGRRVAMLESEPGLAVGPVAEGDDPQPTPHQLRAWSWDSPETLPAGVYFLVLQGERSSDVRKLVVR